MVEKLHARRIGALDAIAAGRNPVDLSTTPVAVRLSYRGRPASLAAVGAAFGVTLPETPCRFNFVGGRGAFWVGPDEWILLAVEGDAAAIAASIEAAVADQPHSLVDVSHRSTTLEIAGPKASDTLNVGCALDLSLEAFPVGMCTRTLIGRASVLLARVAPEVFHIDVWRSFSPYLWRHLDDARREYLI